MRPSFTICMWAKLTNHFCKTAHWIFFFLCLYFSFHVRLCFWLEEIITSLWLHLFHGLMWTKTSQCRATLHSVKWSERGLSPVIQQHKIFKSAIIDFISACFRGLFTVGARPGWEGISIWIWGQPHTVFTQLMVLNPCYHLKWSLIFSSHICFIFSRWELWKNLTSALFLIKPLRQGDISVYLNTLLSRDWNTLDFLPKIWHSVSKGYLINKLNSSLS